MVVFDLETTGLMQDPEAFPTVGVSHDVHAGQYGMWDRKDLKGLASYLKGADIVSGFNILRFDLPFLERETGISLDGVAVLDPFQHILKHTGRFVGLDKVLGALWPNNPEMRKSDSGADAIGMYRRGEIERLRSYCALDVYLETAVALEAVMNGLMVGDKTLPPMTEDDIQVYKTSLKPIAMPTAVVSKSFTTIH